MDGSRWAVHGGLRLHYLDSDHLSGHTEAGRSANGRAPGAGLDLSAGPPVVFVPGLSDVAADYHWLLGALRPRRTLVLDLRGRGPSDAPVSGYRAEDHAADLGTVLDAAGLDRVYLVSFSRGTVYALTYALAHPERLAGLVVADYPARQTGLPPDFADWWMTRSWRGRPMTEIMRPDVVSGIQHDSVDEDLWDRLGPLTCPVLLLRAARGILDEAAVARWHAAVPGLRTVVFENSGHDIFKRERERFVHVLRDFTSGRVATKEYEWGRR